MITKFVINDHGGTKTAADFGFRLNGAAAQSFGVLGTLTLELAPGRYSIDEPAFVGYRSILSGCTDVVLVRGQTARCTLTNDDIEPGFLVIRKIVVNNHGGLKTAADFSYVLDDDDPEAFPEDGTVTLELFPGTYNVTEPAFAGYATSFAGCTEIVVVSGETVTCTITNDDIEMGTLVIVKVVVNDNGGTATATNFSVRVNGGALITFGADGTITLKLLPGTYSVTEPAFAGYLASFAGCASIVVVSGGTVTCTITNDDVAPPPPQLSPPPNVEAVCCEPSNIAVTQPAAPVPTAPVPTAPAADHDRLQRHDHRRRHARAARDPAAPARPRPGRDAPPSEARVLNCLFIRLVPS